MVSALSTFKENYNLQIKRLTRHSVEHPAGGKKNHYNTLVSSLAVRMPICAQRCITNCCSAWDWRNQNCVDFEWDSTKSWGPIVSFETADNFHHPPPHCIRCIIIFERLKFVVNSDRGTWATLSIIGRPKFELKTIRGTRKQNKKRGYIQKIIAKCRLDPVSEKGFVHGQSKLRIVASREMCILPERVQESTSQVRQRHGLPYLTVSQECIWYGYVNLLSRWT